MSDARELLRKQEDAVEVEFLGCDAFHYDIGDIARALAGDDS